jgi:DHA3 family macrolide efflux protein-like MFS transporter
MEASTSLMVPKEHLTRVQGFNQTLRGALNIVSAPAGALLIAVLPMQGVLAIDVVTALIAVSTLLFIHVPQPERRPTSSQSKSSFQAEFWADLREGFRYVWSWPALLLLMVMAMVVNILLSPAFSLLPLLVVDQFGGDAMQLGFIESAFGVGLVVGGILLGIWGGFKRRILTSLVGLIGLGISTIVLGLTPDSTFILAVLAGFSIGYAITFVDGPINAIFQATVAPEMQGRVFMLLGSAAKAMTPLGLILAGPLADVFGVRAWFVAAGLLTLGMGMAGFFMPLLLHIEDGRSPELDEAFLEPMVKQETAVADATT